MHAEHLNTPRLVADAAGATVWRWDQVEPFGVNVQDENPSGLGAFEFPLRFPGHYADKETGLHYNYFRDYDPSLGMYKQSDPIGLNGGLNTYVYALADPLTGSDPQGLRRNSTAPADPYPWCGNDPVCRAGLTPRCPRDPERDKCILACFVKAQGACQFIAGGVGIIAGAVVAAFCPSAGFPVGSLVYRGGAVACAYAVAKECRKDCKDAPPCTADPSGANQ